MKYFRQCDIDFLAEAINTEWKYSWYWNTDDEKALAEKIQLQLNARISETQKKLESLRDAEKLLKVVFDQIKEGETP